MKRLWLVPFVVFITILAYPLISLPDYVIHLNSGRQFVTDRYWKEGGEIKFHFKQGVLGVPKETVVSIEEVAGETPQKEEPRPEEAPTQEKDETKKVEKAIKKTEKKEEKKAEDTKPLHEYWAQKKALKVKLDEALNRLREATRKKDKAAKKKAREDMRKFSKEIYKLTDEVKKINNGELPEDWWKD